MVVKLLKKIFGGGDTVTDGAGPQGEGPAVFVEYVVCELVDNPDQVEVTVEETDQKLAISVRCAKEDIGKVIGRQGRTVSAIRSLVASTSKRDGKKVFVDILD